MTREASHPSLAMNARSPALHFFAVCHLLPSGRRRAALSLSSVPGPEHKADSKTVDTLWIDAGQWPQIRPPPPRSAEDKDPSLPAKCCANAGEVETRLGLKGASRQLSWIPIFCRPHVGHVQIIAPACT